MDRPFTLPLNFVGYKILLKAVKHVRANFIHHTNKLRNRYTNKRRYLSSPFHLPNFLANSKKKKYKNSENWDFCYSVYFFYY